MEIEKTMTVAAPSAQVWRMLLDLNVMGSCVPGMKSIEVVSDVEYIAVIQVKIAFISAKFKLKTTIVEQQAPHYLRCEGTGEDASVASSLKQQSEIFLAELPDGQTELRMKVKVDVLGRLGTFGLSVMKTKADRMWEEFGQNLVARLTAGPETVTAPTATNNVASIEVFTGAEIANVLEHQSTPSAATIAPVAAPAARPPTAMPAPAAGQATSAASQSWWSRVFSRQAAPPASAGSSGDICIEIRRHSETITVRWPLQSATECAGWLQEYLKKT